MAIFSISVSGSNRTALSLPARTHRRLHEWQSAASQQCRVGRHGRNRTNVWTYPGVAGFGRQNEERVLLSLHPTVKPVALVADAILDCSRRGDLVLDAFLGSGTTLIAAERTGRTCYGMELDPLYVDTIIRRWQAYAGVIARHAVSGQSFAELADELGRQA
jgi:DNA modification methylase